MPCNFIFSENINLMYAWQNRQKQRAADQRGLSIWTLKLLFYKYKFRCVHKSVVLKQSVN